MTVTATRSNTSAVRFFADQVDLTWIPLPRVGSVLLRIDRVSPEQKVETQASSLSHDCSVGENQIIPVRLLFMSTAADHRHGNHRERHDSCWVGVSWQARADTGHAVYGCTAANAKRDYRSHGTSAASEAL
jgi:hypothetical protein